MPATTEMLLSNFQKTVTETSVLLSCDLVIDGQSDQLKFTIDASADLRDAIKVRAEPFVIAMLIPAMERGADIVVDGPLDATLLHNLNYNIVRFLRVYRPRFKAIQVRSNTVAESQKTGGSGAVTGMSCGVDSLDTLMRYSAADIPTPFKINALAIFDVGAFSDETPEATQKKRQTSIAKAQHVASSSSVPLFVVASNMDDFFETPFVKSVSLRNLACGYTLADVCQTYLAASSNGYRDVSMKRGDAIGIDHTDQILYPLLTTPLMQTAISGAGVDRLEKQLGLLENSPFVEQVELCTRPARKKRSHKNCGSCAKCGNFLAVAEAHGSLDRFADAFDIEEFKRRKLRVYQRLITSNCSVNRPTETVEYLAYFKAKNIKIPLSARLLGRLYAYWRLAFL